MYKRQVYSSGGDITIALLEKLKAIGVEMREEVIPLAAYGRLIGGDFPNLKLVSTVSYTHLDVYKRQIISLYKKFKIML